MAVTKNGVPNNSPKSFPSPREKPTTLQKVFDSESNCATNTNTNTISSPATFSPTHTTHRDPETQELLSIISYCTFVFTFIDPFESPYQQNLKHVKLSQLVYTIKAPKPPLSDDRILSPLFLVISADLFRPLPPPLANLLLPAAAVDYPLPFDDDVDPLSYYLNPAWPHFRLIYDILLKLVLNFNPNTLCAYVDHPFFLALLSLF